MEEVQGPIDLSAWRQNDADYILSHSAVDLSEGRSFAAGLRPLHTRIHLVIDSAKSLPGCEPCDTSAKRV